MASGRPRALDAVYYQLGRRKMVMDDRIIVVEEAAEGSYLVHTLGQSILTVTDDAEALHKQGREMRLFHLCARDACGNSGRCARSLPPRDTLI